MNLGKNKYTRDIFISTLAITLFYWYFPHQIIIYIGLAYLILALISFPVRKVNHFFWDKLTKVLQAFMQPTLGTIIFCFILIPIGLLWRVFRRKKDLGNTTFRNVNHVFNTDFFQKQW